MIAVFGLIFLIEQIPIVFSSMQLASSIFLAYLAYFIVDMEEEYALTRWISRQRDLVRIPICLLNPKIALFMLAVLSSVLKKKHEYRNKISNWFSRILLRYCMVRNCGYVPFIFFDDQSDSKQLLMNKNGLHWGDDGGNGRGYGLDLLSKPRQVLHQNVERPACFS